MSIHSPGRVKDAEEIAFFLFDPEQVSKTGALKPTIFSYVLDRGRSVQRETIATDDELAEFVGDFLGRKTTRKWHGVLLADAARLRDIKLQGVDGRAVCIYDTGEERNPAHAELCVGFPIGDNGDANELRRLLGLAFWADHPTSRAEYRRGKIHARVP